MAPRIRDLMRFWNWDLEATWFSDLVGGLELSWTTSKEVEETSRWISSVRDVFLITYCRVASDNFHNISRRHR
ncbi:unnamed protein product [Nezara viridula]|uniref:Uncharacterized protein n=1 Tax=Nezara viridula TaxID=85310 RepID=A0A9P0E0U4_NEZVI|nr:unnamed protein product [Nezara viridula]